MDGTRIFSLLGEIGLVGLDETRNGLRSVTTESDRTRRATEDLGDAYKTLKADVSDGEKRLKELKDQYSNVVLQEGRNSSSAKELRNEMTRLNNELNDNKSKLKEAESASDKYTRSLEQNAEVAKNFRDSIENIGKITSGVAAGGIALMTKNATSLEGAVNKVAVATGKGTEGTEELKEVLTSIHDNNYGEDYNDIAEKMALVKQNLGDISDTDLQSITQNAYLLEDAFGMDFTESIRGINGLMQNMGLTADEAFNYMVVGAQNGLNKSDELGDNIAEYSQLWGQAGFSAEEMFTILQNGLDSGAYNLDKVNDLVKEMGISLTDGRIEENLKSFSKDTQKLFKEWQNGGATQSQVIQSIINDFNNMENEQDALTLAGTVWSALGEDNAMAVIKSLGNVNTTYQDTTGAIQEANDQMYSGTGAKAQEAMRDITTAFQKMGDVILPILTPIIEKVSEFAVKFSELDPNIQKVIVAVTGVVAVLTPIILIISKVVTAIGTISSAFTLLTPIITAIGTFITGTLVPALGAVVTALGWPVIAVMAIIGVIVLLWNKCEWFRNLVKGMWEGIQKGFSAALDFLNNTLIPGITNGIQSAWDWITNLFSTIGEWINTNVIQPVVNFFTGLFNAIVFGVTTAWNFITSILSMVAQWIYDNVITPIINFFTPIVEFFVNLITSILDFVKSVIVVIVGLAQGLWEIIVRIFEVVSQWFYDNVITPLVNFFTEMWNTIVDAAKTAWNFIVLVWQIVAKWFNETIIQPVKKFFTEMWNGIVNAAKTAWNFIKETWSVVSNWFNNTLIKPVTNFFSNMWNKTKSGASDAWNGIKSVFSKVADFFGNTFEKAWSRVKSIFSTGGKIFSGITDGISSAFTKTVNAIISGINKVVKLPFEFINGTLNKIRNISFLGISPFQDKWGYNPISVPQIPQLYEGAVLEKGQVGLLEGRNAEAVVPLHENKKWISAVANDMQDTLGTGVNSRVMDYLERLYNLLLAYLPDLANMQMVTDTGALVGELAKPMDKALGKLADGRGRGK